MDIDAARDPFAHPPVTAIFPEYLRPKSLQLDLYPSFCSTRLSIPARSFSISPRTSYVANCAPDGQTAQSMKNRRADKIRGVSTALFLFISTFIFAS